MKTYVLCDHRHAQSVSVNPSVCFFIRLKGRFFYRMVDDSLPQWIRTYPEEAAPRTGDGLFPGEVIEVAQVNVHLMRYPLVLCRCS